MFYFDLQHEILELVKDRSAITGVKGEINQERLWHLMCLKFPHTKFTPQEFGRACSALVASGELQVANAIFEKTLRLP